ncbi:hypothetical protein AB6A40_009272 [Gnathostoma spinigerum]|uniref:Odorant receptor n=1 Tax=Gnathostoma spinigerum TaxID=75299 RepID=A0ABD6ERX2_9BILA
MIIFDKPLESLLDKYIKKHCDQMKEHGLVVSVCYLIGSKVNEDIHIAHISMCPLPETVNDKEGDVRSRFIDAEWIAYYGARVLRLLPGGIDVVGLLWLADKKVTTNPKEILIPAFRTIQKHSHGLSSLGVLPLDHQMALVSIEAPLGQPVGFIVDTSRRGLDGTQTRVSFSNLEWVSIESSAKFHLALPLTDATTVSNFRKLFVCAVKEWVEKFFATKTCLVNGKLLREDGPVRSNEKNRKITRTPLKVDTFVSYGEVEDCEPRILNSYCVVSLNVDMKVNAAVPSKSTMFKAVEAVKEHIVRTLNSRAELHYECTDVVEDEPKDRVAVHQLPRAASTHLPSQPAIVFTDYLFEGDCKADASSSFEELLSLDVDGDDIDDTFERHLGDNDLSVIGSYMSTPVPPQSSCSTTSSVASIVISESSSPKYFTPGTVALISLIVCLFAIVIHLLLRTVGE